MQDTNTNRKPSSWFIAVDENYRKPSYAFKWEMFKIVISMAAYLCDISSDVYLFNILLLFRISLLQSFNSHLGSISGYFYDLFEDKMVRYK